MIIFKIKFGFGTKYEYKKYKWLKFLNVTIFSFKCYNPIQILKKNKFIFGAQHGTI